MDVKAYIESGIIQDYCLGLLNQEDMRQVELHAGRHSEIREEILSYQQALEQYVMDIVQVVPAHHKAKTLHLLNNLAKEKQGLINDLPLLNRYSISDNWLRIVKPLLPGQLTEDVFYRVLRDDGELSQTVVWAKTGFADEVHDDITESFIILEGECDCHVGDKVVRLGPGGYLEVPVHVHHDVKIISAPVLAVVQRLRSA